MLKEQFNIQSIIMYPVLLTRPKQVITTSKYMDDNYIKTLKGERSDTKELNINIKTLTLSHLRDLETANELTKEESEIIKNYSLMSPCFESITYLFFGKDSPLRLKKKKNKLLQQFIPNQIKQKSQLYKQARQNIRNYCNSYYRSNFFIKSFLHSSRMNFKNKLIIIKFLKKIECLPFRKFKQKHFQWKNIGLQI